MSNYAVIKGASYILAAAPDMVLHNGTTQTTEMVVNPESEYLKELPKHLRSFDDVLSYIPNQVYIGNMTNKELAETEFPWYDKKAAKAERYGKYGEIMPQDEFLGLMQICDVFDLVKLEPEFAKSVKEKLTAHGMLKPEQIDILDKNTDGMDEIERLVNEEHAEGLYNDFKLVGAVKRAHDVDANLQNDRATQNIAVKGYASPDGPVKFNDKLSKARSESGKKVVAKLLKDSGLDVDAAAYGEDWDGFKELVEKSDIKDKNLILQVLSLYNSSAERESEIKNMSSVFNELKEEILPELRRSQIVNSTDIQGKTDAVANGAEEQVAILTVASKKFNDARVYNNLGIAQAKAGDKAAALKSFEKAAKTDSSSEINKNLILANLANGNTAEAKKYAQAADAQAKAAIAAAEGDYKSAAKNLDGYNEAVAQVMNNDLSAAKKAIAKDNSADADYLRAVIAAKEGDLKTAEAQLKSAVSKNPKLAQKAANDINLKALNK